jgi:hypothetical protein
MCGYASDFFLRDLSNRDRMINERGARIGRGDRSAQRKPAPLQLCLPQIPHDLTSDRTQATAVGSRSLLVVHGEYRMTDTWMTYIELERM